MTTGLKANCLEIGNNAVSWEDEYAIDGGALTNATRANFKVLKLNDAAPLCFYTGSGALTLSEFANLPKDSVIFATGLAAPNIYFKVAAAGTSTWKSQAVNT